MGINFNWLFQVTVPHIVYSPLTECPKGTYGPYCQRTCKCLNGGNCDTIIGTCDCPPGFIGADCSQSKSLYLLLNGYAKAEFLRTTLKK